MKKKSLLVLLILALMLFAAACGTVSSENAASYTDDIEVPEGKPQPTDGEEQTVDKSQTGTCTLLVECGTILDNMELLNQTKTALVPADGIIYAEREVTFYQGETVFDVLQREMINEKIHFEFTNNPVYNSAYVEGIGNLYEFDCGSLSGWTYSVNGWFPNYGCSRYLLSDGDRIEWRYTCDLGKDVGSQGMQE
ncbi:MAG: DUF4430 domain-containing protein [Firmicutes bacterium]|nr:DUF4430 domain-containing protein [Bacillota bacterium]